MVNNTENRLPELIVGITGASGSIYAKTALEYLNGKYNLHVIATENGRAVFKHECGVDFAEYIDYLSKKNETSGISLYGNNDMFAPIASGSFETDGMIVIPASMSTVSKISLGISDTLLTRAADVCLKERRRLVLCPRETPYSTLHLKNMKTVSEYGAVVFALSPSFYSMPASLEELVSGVTGRALKLLGVENNLFKQWGNC